MNKLLSAYLTGGSLLSVAGLLFYFAATQGGPFLVIPAVCFGLPGLVAGGGYCKNFLQGVANQQPRRYQPQRVGNGRQVAVNSARGSKMLVLENIAPLFGFKQQPQFDFEDWQWEVVPTCYSRKPEIVTEPFVAKMAQWIFNRQQDDITKYVAASRPAWCKEVDSHQGLYWATILLLEAAGAVREWGTSRVLTCTPNRAVVRVKKNCPTSDKKRLYL